MRIKLHNFGIYEEKIFEFPPGKMTYINGDNGTGKTTIFKAILWALYKRGQDVTNWDGPNALMYVLLETDDGILIYRQRNKGNLTVTFPNGTVLSKNVAQEYINTTYGKAETWTATCYLEQGPFHPLLEYNPANRMKLLNQVAFDGDDPTEKINKFTAAIKTTEIQVATLSANARSSYQFYLNTLNSGPAKEEWILPDETIKQYTQESTTISSTLYAKQSQLNRDSEIAGKFSAYENIINNHVSQLNNLSPLDELKLQKATLEKQLVDYKDFEQQKTKHQSLTLKLETLEKGFIQENNLPNYSRTELDNLSKSWKDYSDNFAAAKTLNIEYTQEAITNKISSLERLRDNQWMFNAAAQVSQLSMKIKHITDLRVVKPEISVIEANDAISQLTLKTTEEINIINSSINDLRATYTENITNLNKKSNSQLQALSEEINQSIREAKELISKAIDEKLLLLNQTLLQLNEKLASLNASRHIHTCPHCTGSLRIVNSKLEKSDVTPFNETIYSETIKEKSDVDSRIMQLKNELSLGLNKIDIDARLKFQASQGEIMNQIENERRCIILDGNTDKLNEQLQFVKQEFSRKKAYFDQVIANNSLFEKQTEEIDRLKKELSSITTVEIPDDLRQLTPYELTTLNNQIVTLKRITVVNKPTVTIEDANKSVRWHITNSQILSVKDELLKIVLKDSPRVTSFEIDAINNKITQVQNLTQNLENTRAELAKLGVKPDVESLRKEIENDQARYQFLQTSIRQSARAIEVKRSYDYAWGKELESREASKRLVLLQEMRNIAIKTQADVHYHLVTSVNNFMAAATPILFDTPISVTINTAEENNLGAVTNTVNLNVNYRRKNNVRIDSLSEGEQRQISTLLSLAFSGIFGGKIMILDEAMSCLSPNNREAVIAVLRKTLTGRTVLVTCHGIQKGIFDNVVDVKS